MPGPRDAVANDAIAGISPDLIARYRITAQIGKGGMGYVYRATDTKLGREVAIKVLPPAFAADPDRMARFTREAKVLASLNHRHICTLHEVGPNYLVMEFVEGQQLKGPLPLDKALEYAAQIADALDASHNRKVTHRDLKPANILVTRSAGVKLLDFGLARIGNTAVELETASIGLTGKGQIIGTLQYMSPEQLNGREAGPRSDIFSFGLVLYEMITGRRAVGGSTPASAIAAILEGPAPSVSGVATPALDRVLKRCLAKDPDERWQTARDLKFALELAAAPLHELSTGPPRVLRRPWLWLGASAFVIAGLFAAARWSMPAATPGQRLKTVLEPALDERRLPTLSPDGTRVAFGTFGGLRVRALDSLDSQLIAGTNMPSDPAWSPDGRFLAYFTQQRELKKVDVSGGTPQTLASGLAYPRGITWNRDGTILFSTGTGPLLRVSENGGTPAPVTIGRDGTYPKLLPDGRHFLFLVQGAGQGEKDLIFAGSLDSADTHLITEANSQAEFVPPGHLLFLRGTTLMVQPFDAGGLRVTGQAVALAEDIAIFTVSRQASFSVARNGLIAYQTGGVGRTPLTWVDRTGKPMNVVDDAHFYFDIALSPDGKRIAASRVDEKTPGLGLWVTDLERGITTRITPEGENPDSPAWSPDGKQIAYTSNGIRVRDADGTGREEVLAAVGHMPNWSPDGRTLAIAGMRSDGLLLVPTAGSHNAAPYIGGNALQPSFSPDGRWMAYASLQAGQWEVFVESVPAGHGKWQISIHGGAQPVWRHDGAELFYRSAQDRIMALPVRTGSTFEAGVPKELFPLVSPISLNHLRRMYAVSPDGQRFLIHRRTSQFSPMILLQNWLRPPK